MNCTIMRPELAAGTPVAAPDAAVPPRFEETLLILDKSGAIQHCGTSAFFGASHEPVTGRHVRDLIPGLALRANTPGYNIAWAGFWFGDGAWRRFEALSADGRRFEVDVRLEVTCIQKKHWLLAHLRRPVAVEAPARRPELSLAA